MAGRKLDTRQSINRAALSGILISADSTLDVILAQIGLASYIPTASVLMTRDTNANTQANNFIAELTSTATTSGTTVLTVASNYFQQFTGSSNQTVQLPSALTVVVGQAFYVANRSTGTVTVNDGSGAFLQSMVANSQAIYTNTNNASIAGSWDVSITVAGSGLTVPNVQTLTYASGTFTGQVTSGIFVISSVSSFTNLYVGLALSGTDIAIGAYITALDSIAGTVTMSAAATGGTATTVTVTYISTNGTYVVPAGALYLTIEMVGGGGGGAGSGSGGGTGGTGTSSFFGAATANPGTGGTFAGASSVGGTATLGGYSGIALQGASGGGGGTSVVATPGTGGGSSPFGGAGGSSPGQAAGGSAIASTGSGGGGAAYEGTNDQSGGGAAGGYVKAWITGTLAATYSWKVGDGGGRGGAGSGGSTGGLGGTGVVIVVAYFQ
jgi:hypothetical protein